MDKQFDTMEFYKSKVTKVNLFIMLGAVCAASLVCVVNLIFGFFKSTPMYWYIIFFGVAAVESIWLIIYLRRIVNHIEIEDE